MRILRTILFVLAFALLWQGAVAQRWHKATLPAPYDRGYYLDVFFLPSDNQVGWACDRFLGYVVRTTNGGRTWTGSRVGSGTCHLEYIQFLDRNTGYASGPCGIFKSTDGGATWSADIRPLIDTARPAIWGAWFRNVNEGWATGGTCGQNVFLRTTDGGTSWTSFVDTTQKLSKMSDPYWDATFPPNTVYAVGAGVLWKSTDDGVTWEVNEPTGTSKPWHEELSMNGASILLPDADGGCAPNAPNGGRFSSDMGLTWRYHTTTAPVFGSFLQSPSKGWLAGDARNVWYTANAGATWQLRACGLDDTADTDDIWIINDSTGWVAGDGLYFIGPPTVETDGAPIDFTNACPDRDNLDTITIRAINWSATPVTVSLEGADTDLFSIRNTIPATINSCGSQRVVIAYRPTREGRHSAFIRIRSTFPDTTIIVPLAGDRRAFSAAPQDTLVEWSDKVGAISERTNVWSSRGGAAEQIIGIQRISGDTSVVLRPIGAFPQTVGPGPLQLIAAADVADTGWTEARFKVTIGPCLRDTFITVRVYGRSPIMSTRGDTTLVLGCQRMDTIRVPVQNSGNDVLRFQFVRMEGPAAAAFRPLFWTSGAALPGAIPAKKSDTLVVQYAVFSGDDRATLVFEHDDNTRQYGSRNPWTLEFHGRSTLPVFRIEPRMITFDTICVGQRSTQEVLVFNTGSVPFTTSLTGLEQPFLISSVGGSIGPSLRGRYAISFVPTAPGNYQDTLFIRTSPCDSLSSVIVRGFAGDNLVTIMPRAIDTIVDAAVSIVDGTVRLRASGRSATTIQSIRLEPPSPDVLLNGGPLPDDMPPDSERTVDLTYRGAVGSSYTGVLIVEGAGDCTVADSIPVRFRRAVLEGGITAPDIHTTILRCDESVIVDSILVTSASARPLVLERVGARSARVTTPLPATVAAGRTIAIRFEWIPDSDTDTDTLTVVPRTPDGRLLDSVNIVLRIERRTVVLQADTSLIALGTIDRCEPIRVVRIPVWNRGTVPADLNAALSVGRDGLDVRAEQTALGSNEQTDVVLTLRPSQLPEGPLADTIVIRDRVCNRAMRIPLTATLVGGALQVAPSIIDLGEVSTGIAEERQITIVNNGSVPRTIVSITIENPVAEWTLATAIAPGTVMLPGDVQTLTVRFAATRTVDAGCTIVIVDRGACDAEHRVLLRANAREPIVLTGRATFRIDGYRATPQEQLSIPIRLVSDVSSYGVDSIRMEVHLNSMLFEIDDVQPGPRTALLASATSPGRVQFTVATDGAGPLDLVVVRGRARAALPDSSVVKFGEAAVYLRGINKIETDFQNGYLVVDVCGPRFLVDFGATASIAGPVPVQGALTVNVTSVRPEGATIVCTDAVGRIVHHQEVDIPEGSSQLVIGLDGARSGWHCVHLQGQYGTMVRLPVMIVR